MAVLVAIPSVYVKVSAQSLKDKIASRYEVTGEDQWFGFHRILFDFEGHPAWVVEPPQGVTADAAGPAGARPWTWTVQWADAYVDRTGVLDLLREGWHHVTIDVYKYRADEQGLKVMAAFQNFLVKELGFSKQTNLIGMSWGGFFSTRYAANYPKNVRRIYLDAPLMVYRPEAGKGMLGPWLETAPEDRNWMDDSRMPVNMAGKIAKAGIKVLLLYGGQDQSVDPTYNCELFASRLIAAGGDIDVHKRDMYGHHPHGEDPDKTATITDFFKN